jgi:hypothetical protein
MSEQYPAPEICKEIEAAFRENETVTTSHVWIEHGPGAWTVASFLYAAFHEAGCAPAPSVEEMLEWIKTNTDTTPKTTRPDVLAEVIRARLMETDNWEKK